MKTIARSRIAILALTLASSLATTSAFGEYRLSAFSDTPGFSALLNKDAETAQAIFAPRKLERMDYFEANNLCIAQILLEEFDAAVSSCSSALDKVELSSELSLQGEKVALAAIYSNLAVAKVLSGDAPGASVALETALSLNKKDGNASVNYALISSNLLAGD